MSAEPGDYQRLLQLLYQAPVAIVACSAAGAIHLANPLATRVLMPFAPRGFENIFAILDPFAPELRSRIEGDPRPFGRLVESERIALHGDGLASCLLSLTVERLDKDTLAFAFSDVTALALQEERLREALTSAALARGRAETAASVLHDIGNAITGAGTTVARFVGEAPWSEVTEAERLAAFLASERAALEQALGGERAGALVCFVETLAQTLAERRDDYRAAFAGVGRSLAHVQEILHLQRRYAFDGRGEPARLVDARALADDALAILASSLAKRGLEVERAFAAGAHGVRGDRTRLLQVVINLVKNAAEAMERMPEGHPRRLRISTLVSGDRLALAVEDTGPGFESSAAETLFERDRSDKHDGPGLGLRHAREVARAHGGEITLESPGPGRGARAVLVLPLDQEASDVT